MKTYLMESTPDNSFVQEVDKTFICDFCKSVHALTESPNEQIAFANYDTFQQEDGSYIKICKTCSSKVWADYLAKLPHKAKITLYLSKDQNGYYVSNWLGTFKKRINYVRESWHNIGGKRFDFWFKVSNNQFHGYQIGSFNEIAHCRVTK